jgi:glycosyltransferase involved in cell wall biosynthesis
MLVRGPSPLLPSIIRAVYPLPTVLLIVGDYLAGINDLPQPRWRKEAIRLWSYWNTRGQFDASRKSLTFVNSHKLYNDLKPYDSDLIETRTTTLTSKDFYFRADTCQKKPYHILYAGRMDRGKGLMEVGQAIINLILQGEDIHFGLVGWQERGDPILDELKTLFEQNGFIARIHDLGYKPVGEELFACYRNADIFVNASLASEGFPRTLWEAMANSLPIVATRVGSIPDYAENAVELIPPRDVEALSKAILNLLHTPTRRMELISNGMELVRQNTLEVQTKKMISEIELWLQKRK